MVWMLMLPVTTILIMLRRGGGRGGGSAGPRRGPHKEDDLEVDNHKKMGTKMKVRTRMTEAKDNEHE